MEFVTTCLSGSSRVWRLQSEAGKVSIQMIWSTGLRVFGVMDAVIDDTVGLSAVNRKLLLQRGINDGSLPLDSIKK